MPPITDHHPTMKNAVNQMRDFLQFIALQFITNPAKAELRVAETSPGNISFRLILESEDVARLIGKNGFTASAIRNMLKSVADRERMQVSLRVHSHEEEAQRTAEAERKNY